MGYRKRRNKLHEVNRSNRWSYDEETAAYTGHTPCQGCLEHLRM